MVPLSQYETLSEISNINYIDALGQLLFITEIGGLFLDINTQEKISQFFVKGNINKIRPDVSADLLMIRSRDQVHIINVKDKSAVWKKTIKIIHATEYRCLRLAENHHSNIQPYGTGALIRAWKILPQRMFP